MNKMLRKLMAQNRAPAVCLAMILNRFGFYMFNRWMRNQGFRLEYVLYIHKVAAQQKSLDLLRAA